jgi:hypothetical protein
MLSSDVSAEGDGLSAFEVVGDDPSEPEVDDRFSGELRQ